MSAADKAIRASATAAVLGVAGIAAYVSYQHAYQVIAAHGETGTTARLEPATIDGLVCSSGSFAPPVPAKRPVYHCRTECMWQRTTTPPDCGS